ncbi:ferritin-like protein [Kitasatospora sp. NPDC059571]|uniref:ferritin-like domain-containing protein n=1 Tax=Kitasatospora sp. NPDC059571 TaxID=3346871 RepID=UPI0036B34533
MTEATEPFPAGRRLGRRGFLGAAAAVGVPPAVRGVPTAPVPVAAADPAPGAGVAAAVPAAGRSAARLLAVPGGHRDVPWIRDALQTALELELATLPPYLCAWWSIRDRSDPAARLIQGIVYDEMFHMALVCNLLVAVGGRPSIVDGVMSYPGPLPGGVREDLTVRLAGLGHDFVRDVMMGIELPEAPVARVAGPPSIGSFYDGLAAAFEEAAPELAADGQLRQRIGPNMLEPVARPSDVARVIETVKEQGEGTSTSPECSLGREMLGHYYAFGEIYHERMLERVDGVWEYSGDPLPFPDVRPMGVVPADGWPSPERRVRRLLHQCDALFTTVLRELEAAWDGGGHRALGRAVAAMRSMEKPATALMDIPVPGTDRTYGPQFRPLSDPAS